MKEHFFMRAGIGAGAGMILHEFTKNFEKGRRFVDSSEMPESGSWARYALPAAFASEGVPYDPTEAAVPGTGFLDTLYRRRSIRAYARSPLPFATLGRFLGLCYPSDVAEDDYTAEDRPHQSLNAWNGHVTACKLVLLARDVKGLEPGAYLVDERACRLRPVAPRDPATIADLLERACFQKEFHAAPALFLQIGSIHDAVTRYGERGYRYLLLENGVLLQRTYLAAAALNLAGCVTGSLIQKHFDEWIGVDGYMATVLNGFALGLRPDDGKVAA